MDKRNIDPYVLYFSSLHVYRYKDIADIPKPLDEFTKLKTIRAKMNFVTCKLCKETFKRQEINKVIPLKMIYEYVYHLKKRSIVLFDYID